MIGIGVEYVAHVRKSDETVQRLESHLSDVGELAAGFAEKVDLPDAGRLLGLLHDFGKYSQDFQDYINSATGRIDPDQDDYVDADSLRGKIDHSSAGAQHVWQALSRHGPAGQGALCGQILALCIASHHSGLINCLDEDGTPTFCNRMQKPDVKTHLEECLSKANRDNHDLMQRVAGLAAKSLVAKMFGKIKQMVMVPRSSKEEMKTTDTFILGMFVRFLFSCLVDADRLNSAEFENPERKVIREKQEKGPDWTVAIDRVEDKIKKFDQVNSIDRIRTKISEDCVRRAHNPQGTYLLTVPTGGGKTLASLRYALHHAKHHKLDRIIYVIPYTSITEQNACAVRDILEKDGDSLPWVLEHHSNLDPDKHTWHSKLVTENWDTPIVFTTMVQFLETLFGGGTKSARRMHQLARSVLIFDEIQTLPITCVHMFCNALNFLTQNTKTTAILCTATQPLLDKLNSPENGKLELAPDHDLITDKYALAEQLHRVDILDKTKVRGWPEDEIARQALANLKEAGNCLVIVNTKKWAQRLFLACENHCEENEIFHLSTHQCPAHRRQLLDKIKQRLKSRQPVLCISTQLIEAGVDISFASVIRFLAGLDSIAQAAGRCNRHGELGDALGKVEIINPTDESLQQLTDIQEGVRNAERVLREVMPKDLLAPGTLERYFQYYYFNRSDKMVYPLKSKSGDSLLNQLSANSLNIGRANECLNVPNKLPLLKQSFMEAGKTFKAIDAPTRAVVVQHGDEGKEIVNQLCSLAKEFSPVDYYKVLKRAQQFSVNVFPNVWKQLQEQGAVYETQEGEGVFYLEESHYDKKFGLSMEPVTPMPFQSVGP